MALFLSARLPSRRSRFDSRPGHVNPGTSSLVMEMTNKFSSYRRSCLRRMSGLVLKSRPAVSLGRRCLSLSAVSSTEKHTMPNPIDHATGENPLVPLLKVLTNEKTGGLNVAKFSKESVLTLSCEKPKTAHRTLFLSFETIYCFLTV
jgi:hypothetical protein